MERKLIDYLPPVIAELREFRLLTAAEDPEFDLLWGAYDRAMDSAFIADADEAGVARYEKMFGLASSAEDSLEDRKARIVMRQNIETPFTYRWLISKLNSLYGEDNIVVSLDTENLTMTVGLKLGSKSYSQIVRDLLKRVVPANISYTVNLLYNRWETIEPHTWNELKTHVWNDVKEEVI
jgi:hypothetical protein